MPTQISIDYHYRIKHKDEVLKNVNGTVIIYSEPKDRKNWMDLMAKEEYLGRNDIRMSSIPNSRKYKGRLRARFRCNHPKIDQIGFDHPLVRNFRRVANELVVMAVTFHEETK